MSKEKAQRAKVKALHAQVPGLNLGLASSTTQCRTYGTLLGELTPHHKSSAILAIIFLKGQSDTEQATSYMSSQSHFCVSSGKDGTQHLLRFQTILVLYLPFPILISVLLCFYNTTEVSTAIQ